jgi:hypothetical protein
MSWRIGSVVDLPALLLSVTGGVTARRQSQRLSSRATRRGSRRAREDFVRCGRFAAGRMYDPHGCSRLHSRIDIHVV